jgi:hypothetical protein
MSKSTATMDPSSPEALLSVVEPQVIQLQAELAEFIAEEASLRAEVRAINEAVGRADPYASTPPDLVRRDVLYARQRIVDTKLYDLRAALNSLVPGAIAARSAVADSQIDAAALDAAALRAQQNFERLQAEQAEAMAARDTADESGTAEELFQADRLLRRLGRELLVAQQETLQCQLVCVVGARDLLGREAWDADRAVEAAAEQIVVANQAHGAALEKTREIIARRAYLNERAADLQRQIAGQVAA